MPNQTYSPASPHPLQLTEQTLWLSGVKYNPVRELGRGKSAISYLYRRDHLHGAEPELPEELVLKRYCSTQEQTIPLPRRWSLSCAATSGCRARQSSIPSCSVTTSMPTAWPRYIAGTLIIDLVVEQGLDDRHFRPILAMAEQLQRAGWHIDYYPANFVLNEQGLHYIDYEAHPYSARVGLCSLGASTGSIAGIRRFRETGDPIHINKPGQPKPWDEPFLAQRESLLRRLLSA